MAIVTGIELLFCMCGPLERKCSYCQGIFQEESACCKANSLSRAILFNRSIILDDWIKCIFCGNLTWPQDRITKSVKEIKEERKKNGITTL